MVVWVASEESHQAGNRVRYAHTKDALVETLLFAQADARLDIGLGLLDDANGLLRENVPATFNVFIVFKLKGHVLKSFVAFDELEYMVMASPSTQVKMLCRAINRFEPAHVDVELGLALQVANSDRHVRDSLQLYCAGF